MGVHIDPKLCNEMTQEVLNAMKVVVATLPHDPDTLHAWSVIDTYVATTARVLAKTNPSKLREAAQTVSIQKLIQGL